MLELRDDQNRILSKLRFSVVGHAALPVRWRKTPSWRSNSTPKNTTAGDEIAVSVTAPYGGYGLITIEREKVYGYSWFQTNTAEQHSAHSFAARF